MSIDDVVYIGNENGVFTKHRQQRGFHKMFGILAGLGLLNLMERETLSGHSFKSGGFFG